MPTWVNKSELHIRQKLIHPECSQITFGVLHLIIVNLCMFPPISQNTLAYFGICHKSWRLFFTNRARRFCNRAQAIMQCPAMDMEVWVARPWNIPRLHSASHHPSSCHTSSPASQQDLGGSQSKMLWKSTDSWMTQGMWQSNANWMLWRCVTVEVDWMLLPSDYCNLMGLDICA